MALPRCQAIGAGMSFRARTTCPMSFIPQGCSICHEQLRVCVSVCVCVCVCVWQQGGDLQWGSQKEPSRWLTRVPGPVYESLGCQHYPPLGRQVRRGWGEWSETSVVSDKEAGTPSGHTGQARDIWLCSLPVCSLASLCCAQIFLGLGQDWSSGSIGSCHLQNWIHLPAEQGAVSLRIPG